MLLRGADALRDAARAKRALPAFTGYNLEMVQAIVEAGEQTDLPLLLVAGSSAFRHSGLAPLANLALEFATSSDASVGVHLDHSRSLEEITACLELGYTSVMFDGSDLPFDENVQRTKQVVERAHAKGAWVEAELMGIAGNEDVSTNAVAGAMTDPERAEAFVMETDVDALAVAIGNIHGFSSAPADIDLDRLEAIRQRVSIPLVLHGASGLSDETILSCLDRGVAKVNVNAQLRTSYLSGMEGALFASPETSDLLDVLRNGRDALTETAVRIIRLLARSE
ncbi:MAG TPA: class II fructose-bisphosphate aldolase [Acidimicrobiales bacterium]|jgi:ketose-bisphosphate aldolase